MKKHHINRLEKLYAHLGTVNPESFNFDYWGHSFIIRKPDVNVCGTTACALGWAGSMPEFRKRGLKLLWSKYGFGRVEYNAPGGKQFFSEQAGAEFFGLSEAEADELFIPTNSKEGEMSLKDYRRKLRRFIDCKRRVLKLK